MAKVRNTRRKKGKYSIRLIRVPQDVHSLILKKQGEMRVNCNCIVSKETAIYHLIRETEKPQTP